jgi:hypothetical protein
MMAVEKRKKKKKTEVQAPGSPNSFARRLFTFSAPQHAAATQPALPPETPVVNVCSSMRAQILARSAKN